MNIQTQNYNKYVSYKQAIRKNEDLTPFKEFEEGIVKLKSSIYEIKDEDLNKNEKSELYNRLLRNGITSKEQLSDMSRADIMKVNGIGEITSSVMLKNKLLKSS